MNDLRCAIAALTTVALLTLSSCARSTTTAVAPVPASIESASPQADTFEAGLAKAFDASYTTKTAETKEDWYLAANRWQMAIELMQVVPKGSANYSQAQKKLAEYQQNLTLSLIPLPSGFPLSSANS